MLFTDQELAKLLRLLTVYSNDRSYPREIAQAARDVARLFELVETRIVRRTRQQSRRNRIQRYDR